MKYFICALGRASLGFPAGQTERIIPVTREQTIVREITEGETFISIPALFRLPGIPAPHGLVLKIPGAVLPGRIILLTPKIDIDVEIPDEKIKKLPGSFAGVYSLVNGACFMDQGMILLLDSIKLAEKLLMEN